MRRPLPAAHGLGFILTRRVVRRANQELVELWLATDTGPVCLYSTPQQNVCFVHTADAQKACQLLQQQRLSVDLLPDTYRTLNQQPVSLLRYSPDGLTQSVRQLLSAQGIVLYEGDIKLADRFLMERFAYGSIRYKGHPQQGNILHNVTLRGASYRPLLRSLSIDIECDERENLYSIGFSAPDLKHVLLVYPTPVVTPANSDFIVEVVPNEKTLLQRLVDIVVNYDADVLLGWNVKQFDFAVLYRCARRHHMQLAMGRNGSVLTVRQWESGTIADLPGRALVDGIEALKTMTYQFDSFSLDAVAGTLLNRGKLVKEDDQLAAIKALYKHDPLQLARYNIEDCELVNEIAAHTRFIDFLVLRSTLTGLDMSRPGGSVAAFINVYLPRLHRQGYISGIRPQDGGLASPGGYVMASRPGLYDFVLVLDFKSLYPSIIRTFKIDPMGLAEGLANPTTAIEGYKGARFSRDAHFLPEIIANLWKQRDEAKRQQDAPRSQAIKILMNSFYGVLGSGGCPFYDPRLASSITLRGHDIMQTTAQWIEAAGYDVIYGDTDSTFVHLSQVHSREEACQIGKQLEQQINQRWQQRLNKDFNLDCFLEIEFETCFDKFFMPTIRNSELGSKKRYAGLIDSQAQPPKIVFKGLENVRSDWTSLAKTFQQELYTRVFTGKAVERYILDTVAAIYAGQFDELLIYKKRLTKPLAQYTKSVPPHVKAAQQAELFNQTNGLPLQYRNKSAVKYVVTLAGPQTSDRQKAPLDYEHYIEKQIRPIAQSILPVIGLSFDELTAQQMGLF